jgi:transposase InsO family protein
MISVMRVLTDRGTEYCGAPEKHLYELFLQMNDIEHTMTKAKSPQTNGICERFNQTILNEFYKPTFRRTMYKSVEQMQEDLDFYRLEYNEERAHQGKRCKGKTPMQTFLDSLLLAREKLLNDPAS